MVRRISMVIPKDPLKINALQIESLYYLELTWQYPALSEFRLKQMGHPLTPGV